MAATFDEVYREKYLLLTTFTKDGRPKPTAIWAAPDGDGLIVITQATSWKVKRIRNTPRDHATVVVITFSPNPLKQHGVRFPSTGAWFCHFNSGLAAYAKDFDNLGPRPGTGYNLPAGQTTLPLDMSRLSMLVFSKSRPPGATLTKAPYAPEIESPAEREPSEPRPVTDFVEEVLDPFPYVFVPLPAEWHP